MKVFMPFQLLEQAKNRNVCMFKCKEHRLKKMYLRFYVYLQHRQQVSSNVSLNKCVINVAHSLLSQISIYKSTYKEQCTISFQYIAGEEF